MAGSDALSGLAFLVGRWAGAGEWGGKPFACRTHVSRLLERYLQIDVHAEQAGRADHDERVIVHADGDHAVATLYPDRGDVQRFVVQEIEPSQAYRLVFTPPGGSNLSPQRWTIRRTENGYDEIFEIAPGGGAFQPAVTCSYRPLSEGADA